MSGETTRCVLFNPLRIQLLIHIQEEEQDFLDRAQNEIETLRLEVSAKDEEIEHLREVVLSPSRADVPRSLDDEMLSSLKQQHALELSAFQSQVRSLETSLFDAEARAHSMQKQISALEDQVAHPPRRSFSPGIPSRPSSRGADLRRASFGSHKPSNLAPPPLSRSVFDSSLSPETRHKRKVSLSMLKARIDSEAAAAAVTSHPPSRALSLAHSLPTNGSGSQPISPPPVPVHHHHRPQFLDDSHVFWCHSCRGDLVIL